ncbi:hypothetical protein E8E13_000527 [Curvularia kusanoi]|uniref:Transcription factor domain-containing protein n=1 Tax=Curvularia kusanoi TaxID=90978 RepID=A0A9P4TLQ6_CURKU|nr:hypothetical protein E8E13_000527 [Curvularia kusanoi]
MQQKIAEVLLYGGTWPDPTGVTEGGEQTYLQSKSKEESDEAFAAIQNGAVPSEILDAVKNRTDSMNAEPSSSRRNEAKDSGDLRPTAGQDPENSSSIRSSEGALTTPLHLMQSPENLVAVTTPIEGSSIHSPLMRIVNSLGKGAEAFFTCTGCIFHIYDQTDAERYFKDLGPYIENTGKSWLELIFQDFVPSQLKPALCSLCIMAAVGLQYTKEPIPALGFAPSTEDGTFEFVSIFYESARHLLESVIEINMLEAMRACAAMTMFNTIGHATIAMVYVDMGISFAFSLGPNLQFRPANVSESAWIKHKRVARTLVTLRSWLVSTLGYVHAENPGAQLGSQWLMDEAKMTSNETIQQQLNKVVQIEANLLRTINSFSTIAPGVLNTARKDLAQWHDELPDWMQISAILKLTGQEAILRRTVFLVHLFYLSASILLARLAHGAHTHSVAKSKELFPRYDLEEARTAAGDGVGAARTAARILRLQKAEGAVFQRFSAYISCLTLLHSAVQMQLHNYPEPIWQRELSLAEASLIVLEFCAKVDQIAARFAELVRPYYNALAPHDDECIDDTDASDSRQDFNYLFSVPSDSPAHLAQMSHELLKYITRPFDSPSNLHDEGTLRAGLGAHVYMLFNNDNPKEGKSQSSMQAALSNMPTGHFMGSSQPHGWDMFLNLKKL